MKGSFLDYMYYRVAKFYFKWDGRNSITAVFAVSMFQVLIIADTILLAGRFFWDREITSPYARFIGYGGVLLLFIFSVFNFYKYKNRYHKLKSHWKEESSRRYIMGGILVVISLLFPWVVLILLGIKK